MLYFLQHPKVIYIDVAMEEEQVTIRVPHLYK